MEKAGDNIVNTAGDKLNINTTSAEGLEKIISAIATFILKAQDGSNKILYGDPRKKYKRKVNTKGDVDLGLNNGLLNVVEFIASIDLCNIVNFALSQIPNAKPFDPSKAPPSNAPVERAKWAIQYAAYNVQVIIDDFYNVFPNPEDLQSRIGLSNLVTQIVTSLQEIDRSISQSGANDLIGQEYPQISVVNNFLNNVVGYFNKYTTIEAIPLEDLQKILSYVNKTRMACVTIQGINSPAGAIALLDSTLKNLNLQEQIQKLQEIIDPARIIPFLREMLRTATKINDIGRKVLGYVSTARSIITLGVLLLKIFKIIIKFLKSIPIPAMFVSIGITTLISDTAQDKINKFIEKTTQRLDQINAVLSLIVIFINSLLGALDIIIRSLKLMVLNLEACSNIEDNLIKEFKDTIENLENTRKDLQTVLDTYNNNANSVNNKFGEYTIEIITEEVVDEGINLRRRYGIARNNENNIVVNSTPTFASLDQIIVDEVKFLLMAGGFVDKNLRDLNGEQIRIVTESLNYLEDGSINIQDIEASDSNIFEQGNVIGITPFLNNLSGGRQLRKNVRKLMQESTQNLNNDLKNTDPGSKYKSNLSK
jgi:hypothetical protein